MTKAHQFLDLACLKYGHADSPSRRESARELLRDHPDIVNTLAVAAALGLAANVQQCLAQDPAAANTKTGPRQWEPLLYLTYSRVQADDADYLATARALFDAGADAKAHFLWGGDYHFSALTGVFGEGEAGPNNFPEHPCGLELARLLLTAGANPNDSQGLYNRMFRPERGSLALLLEFGLDAEARNNWRHADGTPDPNTTLHYQLMHACREGYTDRVKLIVNAGVDVNQPAPEGVTPLYAAMAGGNRDIAALLQAEGARAESLDDVAQFTGVCLAAEEALARRLLGDDPALLQQALIARPTLLSDATRRVAAVELLLELGADPNPSQGTPPLHQALWCGRIDAATALLRGGARGDLKDPGHGSDAAGWARHGGFAAAIDWVETNIA